MNELLKEYFSLTNNEQRGIISLVLIILFVFIGPRLYLLMQAPDEMPQDNTHLFAKFKHSSAQKLTETAEEFAPPITLFSFDPNTVTLEDLINLGVKENVANTLLNYRSKGGKFYKKEDFKKIYGISEEEYMRLKDFMYIKSNYSSAFKSWEKEEKVAFNSSSSTPSKKVEKAFVPVDINTADSSLLTTVKGIGPVYASRIVKYRKLLGGYLSKEQLLEVYGIDEETYAAISSQLSLSPINKSIKVNTATWYELKSHPYISSDLANIILNYIKAHGQLKDLQVLVTNGLIEKETLTKINPYLSFKE